MMFKGGESAGSRQIGGYLNFSYAHFEPEAFGGGFSGAFIRRM